MLRTPCHISYIVHILLFLLLFHLFPVFLYVTVTCNFLCHLSFEIVFALFFLNFPVKEFYINRLFLFVPMFLSRAFVSVRRNVYAKVGFILWFLFPLYFFFTYWEGNVYIYECTCVYTLLLMLSVVFLIFSFLSIFYYFKNIFYRNIWKCLTYSTVGIFFVCIYKPY